MSEVLFLVIFMPLVQMSPSKYLFNEYEKLVMLIIFTYFINFAERAIWGGVG